MAESKQTRSDYLPPFLTEGPGRFYDVHKYSDFTVTKGKSKGAIKGVSFKGRTCTYFQSSNPYTDDSTAPPPPRPSGAIRQSVPSKMKGCTISGRPYSKIETDGPGPAPPGNLPSLAHPQKFGPKNPPGKSMSFRLRQPSYDDDEYTQKLDIIKAYELTQSYGKKGQGIAYTIGSRFHTPGSLDHDVGVVVPPPPPKMIKPANQRRETIGRRYHIPSMKDDNPGPGTYNYIDTWKVQKARRERQGGYRDTSLSMFIDSRIANKVLMKADIGKGGLPF